MFVTANVTQELRKGFGWNLTMYIRCFYIRHGLKYSAIKGQQARGLFQEMHVTHKISDNHPQLNFYKFISCKLFFTNVFHVLKYKYWLSVVITRNKISPKGWLQLAAVNKAQATVGTCRTRWKVSRETWCIELACRVFARCSQGIAISIRR